MVAAMAEELDLGVGERAVLAGVATVKVVPAEPAEADWEVVEDWGVEQVPL